MPLTDRQIERITRLIEDQWESEDEFASFFDSISDPEELHLFADGWNWDAGVEELDRVIEHPLCDRGTALLIYWRAKPGYYLKYPDRAAVPHLDLAVYDLLRKIEALTVEKKFAGYQFPFDPRNDRGIDWTPKPHHLKHGRMIPSYMWPMPGPNSA